MKSLHTQSFANTNSLSVYAIRRLQDGLFLTDSPSEKWQKGEYEFSLRTSPEYWKEWLEEKGHDLSSYEIVTVSIVTIKTVVPIDSPTLI